jgi:3-oxoacyl-[acyl-carrier-protein] synthase II
MRPIANHRVAITGVGVVSCVGIGKDAFWAGINGPAPSNDRRRVDDWDPSPWMGPKEARRADRFTQFGLAAAEMALDDAGRPTFDPDRAGVYLATGVGGISTIDEQVEVRLTKGEQRVTPFLVPMMMSNAAAGSVSIRLGWRGPSETTVTACASATHGIGNAARIVASGRCTAVLAGGSEAPMTPTGVAGFWNMTAMSRAGISRPFDVARDGFVIGEGAAVLLLEDLEHALARGAHIYAEVLGASNTADAHHITAPEPEGAGAIAAMRFALEDAELDPSAIGHINAHGTSTPLNDLAEAKAVRVVFGDTPPPTTSIKGVTGHSLGASGALEAASVVLSIEHRIIPPTRGTTQVDPEIELDIVLEPRPWEPAPVLSNSFGFGGHNGSLVIGPVRSSS